MIPFFVDTAEALTSEAVRRVTSSSLPLDTKIGIRSSGREMLSMKLESEEAISLPSSPTGLGVS